MEALMKLYAILRRDGWRSPEDLGAAAERSRQVADEEMSDDIRWIRSYVLEEGAGSIGTVCIYEASSPEAIREHAQRARPVGDRDHSGHRHRRGPKRPAAGQRLNREGGAANLGAAPS
jgi:hypothetical protein